MWSEGRRWFSPLVSRELLVFSRRIWTHWGRVTTGLGAILILAGLGIVADGGAGLRNGSEPLMLLFLVLFVTATLGGFRTTFDCVSRERREGTLGLLFLTDLKATTILFAKLVSSSLQNVYAILAVFPVLAACFLAGGVSATLFIQASLAVLSALFLSLNTGLYHTCVTDDDHEAFSKTLRSLLLVNALPVVSPAWLLCAALAQPPYYFWLFVGPTFVMGLVYWFRACDALSFNWRGLRPRSSTILEWSPAAVRDRPVKPCGDVDPAYWIMTRFGDPRQVKPAAIVKSMLVALCLIGVFAGATVDLDIWSMTYLYFMNLCKLLLWLAMCKLAPQGFARVVKGGAVEILLTTPLTMKRLVGGLTRFLIGQFGRAVGVLLAVDLGMILLMSVYQPPRETLRFVWQVFCGESVFLMGLFATAAFGVWMGLRHERYSQAVFRTVTYVIVGAGVIVFIASPRFEWAWGSVLTWFTLCGALGCWQVYQFVASSRDGANLTAPAS